MKKVLFITYFIFLSTLTLFSYLFVDPNLSYLHKLYSGFVFSYRQQTTFLYILIISSLFIFYFIFLGLLKKKFLSIKDLKLLIFISVSILFFSYPAMLSYDIFNYIATGKVLFFYHENPYVVMPIEFAKDPLLGFTHAANKIALYGPVWIILTAIPYVAGFGNFLLIFFNLKLFIAIFYLLTLFIIWKLSKDKLSVCLFGLNPLVMIETLVSGHNDIVMIFFVLFSFLLFKNKKIVFGLILFALSIFVKYATLFLLPVFIYILLRQIRKKEVNWEKYFYFSTLLMLGAFLLSPIREEIYPWYAIWFLPFSFLVADKKLLLYISMAFSFGLLFRYVPFIFLGSHAGPTPIIKSSVTFIPVCLVLFYFVVKKIWAKISSR